MFAGLALFGSAKITIIVVFFAILLIALAFGLPISFSLILCAAGTGYLLLGGGNAKPLLYAQQLMRGTDSVTMMALPFFVVAGELMNRGGLTDRIIKFCNIFVGRIPGGLGYVTILACLLFAALVGSAVASTAALGAILIPMMAKSGYDRAKSAALVASANLVAPIMPPSIPFIIYAISAKVSVKSMFMGGIAPAIYLTVLMSACWFFISRKDCPPVDGIPKMTFKEIVRTFTSGLWALLLPGIILFGLRGGVFTATEAGVIAVVYALIVGAFVYKELKFKDFISAMVSSAKMSAVVMFLAATAQLAAYTMTVAHIPEMMTEGLSGLVAHPILLNFTLMLIVIVVGLAMDVVPCILILTPIFLPLVIEAGLDPVAFGVLFCLANVLGLTSPPVGPVLNVACATGKVTMEEIIPPTMPYFIAQCALLLVLSLCPALIEVPLHWLGG
ncbi:TRAP transporter large permease [Lacrimispora sp.]|jgi:tripartite ATP-independent transporter DctM subunit|uniref:TRAP transporter large permease n=1 Tax=Lacrimispora sp. TaxID=2719234 RepID=UPI00289D0529|nr:TRAP transporter large permease [Lacrimispora sp.]